MKNQLSFLLLLLFFFSCGKKYAPVYEQIVRSPIPEKDIPFTDFTVDADSAILLTMETGSLVRFDSSSFETTTGSPVKGKITIKVREFHTPEALFRAGIPMSTDESRKNFLQSGGMIEVRAFQQDQELKLKAGKDGYIELAGFRPSDGYSLYQLGDDVLWRVKDSFQSRSNVRKKDRLAAIEARWLPDSLTNKGFEIAADLSEAPHLKPYKGLTWEPVKVLNKGSLDMQRAARMGWDSVKVFPVNRKENTFRLVFIKYIFQDTIESKKEWSVLARPLLNGKSMSAILKEDERIKKMLEEEKKRLEKQADMVNSFRINQMGIWNIDKIMKIENAVTVALSFDFASTIDTDVQKVMVYMLFEDDNSVISLLPKDWKEVRLPQNKKIRFVAMLPNGKAVICDHQEVASALKPGSKELKLKTRPATDKDFI